MALLPPEERYKLPNNDIRDLASDEKNGSRSWMSPSPQLPLKRPTDTDRAHLFPIVGIGMSAGGLEAATEFLKHLPANTGFGFVLVQHLAPQHESALTKLLSRSTRLTVSEITNGVTIAPERLRRFFRPIPERTWYRPGTLEEPCRTSWRHVGGAKRWRRSGNRVHPSTAYRKGIVCDARGVAQLFCS